MTGDSGAQKEDFIVHSMTRRAERDNSVSAVAERLLAKPATIHVFTDGPDSAVDMGALTDYIANTFGPNFQIIQEGDVWQYILAKDPEKRQALIEGLAEAKLWAQHPTRGFFTKEEKMQLETQALERDPNTPIRDFLLKQTVATHQLPGLRGQVAIPDNDYYVADYLTSLLVKNLPEDVVDSTDTHRNATLLYTGRGIADHGSGIHMRVASSTGSVGIISTTGIVEAPAPPQEVIDAHGGGSIFIQSEDPRRRELFMNALRAGKFPGEALLDAYEDTLLRVGDSRLTEALKGMSLQVSLYNLGETGEHVFSCSTSGAAIDTTKFCRMHDAHRIEEVFATQINKAGKPEFCDFHTTLFQTLQQGKPGGARVPKDNH